MEIKSLGLRTGSVALRSIIHYPEDDPFDFRLSASQAKLFEHAEEEDAHDSNKQRPNDPLVFHLDKYHPR